MKNWKQIYEEYKTAALKPSIFDKRYEKYNLKMKSLESFSVELWKDVFKSLSSGCISFSGESFLINLNENIFNEHIPSSFVRELNNGRIEDAKNILKESMTHDLGSVIMNRHVSSLADIRQSLIDIERCLEKVDSNLVKMVRDTYHADAVIQNRIRIMTEARENRYYAPKRLWNDVVRAYADQELFVEGKSIYGYGTIEKVTDKMLIFTNGNKKKKETMDIEWVFTHEHPECPKKVFDVTQGL